MNGEVGEWQGRSRELKGVHCGSDVFFFFFNDTATTEIYTLSLHDALPISNGHHRCCLLHHWFEAAAEQLCSNQDHRTLSSYLHHLCKTTIHDVPFLGNCRYPTFFSKLNDFTLYYKVLDLDDTSGRLTWGTMMQVLPWWSPVFVVIRNYCLRRLRYERLNKHMTDNGCIENIRNSQTVHSINEVCVNWNTTYFLNQKQTMLCTVHRPRAVLYQIYELQEHATIRNLLSVMS